MTILAVLLFATIAVASNLNIATIDLPPYGYVKNGAPTGLTFELGNAIAREAGLIPMNRIARLHRGVAEVGDGRADLIIMFPTPTIEAVALNLGQVLDMETVVIGRPGTKLCSPDDLHGKTVASVRDAKYDNRISGDSEITLYACKSYLHGLKLMLAKRVDAIIGPKLGLYHTIKTNDLPRQEIGEPLVLSVAHATVFLSRKAPAHYAHRLHEAIKRLKANGTIDKLVRKYSL